MGMLPVLGTSAVVQEQHGREIFDIHQLLTVASKLFQLQGQRALFARALACAQRNRAVQEREIPVKPVFS